MLTLDTIQQSILAQATTTPTYLVDIEWDGLQHWSTHADHTVDGIDYAGGEIGVRGAQDWRTAGRRQPHTDDDLSRIGDPTWLD